MAEGARLESVFTGNRNVGSNPTPSAIIPKRTALRREFAARKREEFAALFTQPLQRARPPWPLHLDRRQSQAGFPVVFHDRSLRMFRR